MGATGPNTDFLKPEERSERMSRIRGQGNLTTELRLAKLLRALGMKGWRRHVQMFGRPDFVFRAKRVVIFVDGCFWHGCPHHYIKPATNAAFWEQKISANRKRDRLVNRTLRESGWSVLRIWEHELRMQHRAILEASLRRALGVPWPKAKPYQRACLSNCQKNEFAAKAGIPKSKRRTS